jgi:hypothetical protein
MYVYVNSCVYSYMYMHLYVVRYVYVLYNLANNSWTDTFKFKTVICHRKPGGISIFHSLACNLSIMT